MIDFNELKFKDYKTVTFRGIDIDVSAELLQDINAGTQPLSLLERIITQEYNRLLPVIRNKKIDSILDATN
jgi:hypothetical protein